MKKEVFFAITIGFILGLVITFGVWTANKSLKQLPQSGKSTPSPTQTTSVSPSIQPAAISPTPTSSLPLTLSTPDDESISNKDTVTLTGKTSPGAVVSIISETTQTIISPDKTGTFTAPVTLDSGYNTIRVVATDPSGNSASKTLTITFTTAKI